MILFYIVILTVFICPIFSQEIDYKLAAETDKVRYRIGDRITLLIHADISHDQRVLFPSDTVDVSPFTLLNYRILPPEQTSSGLRETLELTLSIYQTGEFEIPSIEVVIVSEDGSKHSASTQKQSIVIESILSQDEALPRGAKSAVDVKARKRFVIAVISSVILIILLTCLAGGLVRKWRQHRKTHKVEIYQEPLKPADQEALEALEELRASRLLAKGELKTYFIRLTEILKIYIGRRFAFNATEHTTGEIRADMRKLHIDSGTQTDILHVLDLADMVKFARFLPTDEQCRQAMIDTEKIIHRTRETFGKQMIEDGLKPEKAARI